MKGFSTSPNIYRELIVKSFLALCAWRNSDLNKIILAAKTNSVFKMDSSLMESVGVSLAWPGLTVKQ